MPLHGVDGYFFLFISLFCSGGIAAFAGFLESSLSLMVSCILMPGMDTKSMIT